MFQSIRSELFRGAAGRRRALDLRSVPRALVRPLSVSAAALLLARAEFLLGLSPFGAAFFAAGLFAGENAPALLLGTLAGAALGGLEWTSLLLPAGCALILGGFLLLDGPLRAGKFPADTALGLLAGVGVLVPGLAGKGAALGPLEIALTLAAAMIAAMAAPALAAALRLRRGRTRLLPDERAGLAGIACAALIGLMNFQLPALRWCAEALAAAMTLLLAGLGPGAGAAAGLLAGLSFAVGGLPVGQAACWATAGLTAGVCARFGRWAAALALFAALALGLLYAPPGSLLLFPALAAAGLLLLPRAVYERLLACLDGTRRGACDPDLLAARLRGETEQKLRALSAAFGELAEGYKTPIDMPDEQALLTGMREALCQDCARYGVCWTGDDNRAVRLLCQLISQAIERGGGPQAEEETPPDVMRVCARGHSIPQRLGGLLQDFSERRRSELKRSATTQLISAQFLQAQMLLRGMADRQAQPLRVRDRQAARVLAALDRAGIPAADVFAFRGEKLEIVILLGEGQWTPERAGAAAACVSRELNRRFVAEARQGLSARELKLVQLPALSVQAGVSCLSGEAGVPSGDSHMVRALAGDRLMLALSDGMGSGESAARESAQTIKLLWRFLSADVSRALALETVNELMLVKSGEDMFATVDLCLLDLATGRAEFSKLAACRSLIVRGREVLPVEGGRLPLGILEKVRPSVTTVQLKPGDVLLLASDGVMDAVPEEGFIESVLLENTTLPPTALAETVLQAVQDRGGRFRDDMTAICARIGKQRAGDGKVA